MEFLTINTLGEYFYFATKLKIKYKTIMVDKSEKIKRKIIMLIED